jgi:hypothetical protein
MVVFPVPPFPEAMAIDRRGFLPTFIPGEVEGEEFIKGQL